MRLVIGYVDDDATYARALRKAFEQKGAVLLHFDEPCSMLNALDNGAEMFDMTLIDLEMHDTNGRFWKHAGMHVAREVRNRQGGDQRPICVLSNNDGMFLGASSRDNGADAFIQKGRRLDRLAERVIAMIDEDRAKRRSRAARSLGVAGRQARI